MFVLCRFVYWRLPFSVVFCRLCCQICCQYECRISDMTEPVHRHTQLFSSRLCGCVIEHGISLIVPFIVGVTIWMAPFLLGVQIV